jgi:hypothetical protein
MAFNHRGFEARSPVKSDSADKKIREAICLAISNYGADVYETFGENMSAGAGLTRLRELLSSREISPQLCQFVIKRLIVF